MYTLEKRSKSYPDPLASKGYSGPPTWVIILIVMFFLFVVISMISVFAFRSPSSNETRSGGAGLAPYSQGTTHTDWGMHQSCRDHSENHSGAHSFGHNQDFSGHGCSTLPAYDSGHGCSTPPAYDSGGGCAGGGDGGGDGGGGGHGGGCGDGSGGN